MDDGKIENERLIKQNNTSKTSSVIGIFALIFMAIDLAVSQICVQALKREIPDFELNVLRCGLPFIVVASFTILARKKPWVEKENIVAVLLYALILSIGSVALFSASSLIPLTTQNTFQQTASIVIGLVIFKVVNKESVTWYKFTSIALSVVGIFLVQQPDLLFGSDITYTGNGTKSLSASSDKSQLEGNVADSTKFLEIVNSTELSFATFRSHTEANPTQMILGIGLSMLAGTTLTLIVVVFKYFPYLPKLENQQKYYIWILLGSALFSLTGSLSFEDLTLPTSVESWLLVLGHSACYLFAFPALSYGSARVSGNTVTILISTSMIYMAIAQYTVLKNIYPGNRNWIEILGVILVFIACTLSSIIEIYRERC